jgi:hypothetical protein
VNGDEVDDISAPIKLEGNKECYYDIVATDAEGNETVVRVIMCPLELLVPVTSSLEKETVTSDDVSYIGYEKTALTELDTENATDDEKKIVEDLLKKCNDLLEAADAAAVAKDTVNTNAVKDITSENVTAQDKLNLENALADIEKEISDETEVDDVEYEEWENMQGLRDLEDWGAFSDEGIMPGCHSDYYCGFDLEEYKEYERMRQFFGGVFKYARESVGLSTKKLAECMKLPEYIIENIENGEEYIKDKAKESVLTVSPILVEIPVTSANSVIEKQWWEELYDSDIERKILDFLLEYKSKL